MEIIEARETLEEIGLHDVITEELVAASGIVLDRLEAVETELLTLKPRTAGGINIVGAGIVEGCDCSECQMRRRELAPAQDETRELTASQVRAAVEATVAATPATPWSQEEVRRILEMDAQVPRRLDPLTVEGNAQRIANAAGSMTRPEFINNPAWSAPTYPLWTDDDDCEDCDDDE